MSAYNAGQTIKKSLDSCLNQSYKDIEIIVINDCSTDNTKEVVESINDHRIRLINKEVNEGAGLARRTGTQSIKGDYTIFLDSDDYFDDMTILEKLLNVAIKEDADIVSPGYKIVDIEGNIIETRQGSYSVLTGDDKFKKDVADTRRFMNPMLLKAHLWDKVVYNGRRFIEDTPTLMPILWNANKVVTVPYSAYNYVQQPNSLVHSASDTKYSIYKCLCTKDIREYMLKVQDHRYSTLKPFIQCLRELPKLTEEDKELYKDELSELFIYFNNNVKF